MVIWIDHQYSRCGLGFLEIVELFLDPNEKEYRFHNYYDVDYFCSAIFVSKVWRLKVLIKGHDTKKWETLINPRENTGILEEPPGILEKKPKFLGIAQDSWE